MIHCFLTKVHCGAGPFIVVSHAGVSELIYISIMVWYASGCASAIKLSQLSNTLTFVKLITLYFIVKVINIICKNLNNVTNLCTVCRCFQLW